MDKDLNNKNDDNYQFRGNRNFFKRPSFEKDIIFCHNIHCVNQTQQESTFDNIRKRFPNNKLFSIIPRESKDSNEQCEGYCKNKCHFFESVNTKSMYYPTKIIIETVYFENESVEREITPEPPPPIPSKVSSISSFESYPKPPPKPPIPPKKPVDIVCPPNRSPILTHDETSRAMKGQGIEVACPRCGHWGKTDVQYKIGCINITSGLILSLLCCIPCAIVAFVSNCGKNVMHICHNCRYVLGIVKKRPCKNALVWNYNTENIAVPERYRKCLVNTENLATDMNQRAPGRQDSDSETAINKRFTGRASASHLIVHKTPAADLRRRFVL